MTQPVLAKFLQTLGVQRIGMQEAAVLLVVDRKTSLSEIAKTLGVDKTLLRARLGVLRRKGLVTSEFLPDGTQVHTRTNLARRVLGLKLRKDP